MKGYKGIFCSQRIDTSLQSNKAVVEVVFKVEPPLSKDIGYDLDVDIVYIEPSSPQYLSVSKYANTREFLVKMDARLQEAVKDILPSNIKTTIVVKPDKTTNEDLFIFRKIVG